MYTEHSKIRQTTTPEHRHQHSGRGEQIVEVQEHVFDHYAIADINPKKRKQTQKNRKTPSSKKKKTSGGKKSKQKKLFKTVSIGSAENHNASMQKLQLSLGDRGKQKLALIIETQKLRNQNELMMLDMLKPRNKTDGEYIKQLWEKDKKNKLMEIIHADLQRKMNQKLENLEKQKKKYQKMLSQFSQVKNQRK